MRIVLLSLIFIFLTGCLPEQAEVRNLNQGVQETTSNTDSNSTTELGSSFGYDVKWNNAGLNSDILTINVDNSKNIYLMGDKVHDALADNTKFQKSYCMEVRFEQSSSNVPKILRVKVVPSISTNFQTGITTRFFRMNLNSVVGNDSCNLSSYEIKNNTETLFPAGDSNYDGFSDTSVVYHPSQVCSNCTNFLVANKISLYSIEDDPATIVVDKVLKRIDSDLDYSTLGFRIDMNSSSSNGQSTCSDSTCQSEGFDCCVEGQCVNEKAYKISGIQQDPNGFLAADAEKTSNPNWYKNYPQFYYICLEQPPSDNDGATNPNEPTDPVADSQTRLTELIADYECVEELKANSEADPFHRNPLGPNLSAYSKCLVNSTQSTEDMYYTNVMIRLYNNCGCVDKTNLTEMVNNCPAYTYKPVFQTDNNGNVTDTITSITCVTPEPYQTPLPFQDLEVMVNSRSAPHRFFDTNNIEINIEKALPTGASGVQEGEEFKYLDDFYIFPKNGEFNMNSILGQFNISLNGAYPAKIIDIEFDKQYIISTLEGFLSSCPTCAKDSWFGNFSFAPTANRGVGLQAVNFTTQRDTYNTNLTLGNYEDTIFGRACWIPPTMLPYAHTENSNQKLQRENRLQAQAALYINGYQNDWYGFNRGALIGSFDGVTWFAIGKGRIVKSTSNKLFLAINAPFADLANATNHKVAVQEYDFSATAAQFDYVNGLEINDSAQNEAGSCQYYHQCEADSDCITKLGWEYVCADVTYMQSKWPSFEALGASEIANTSRTGTIVDFLQQASLPPDSGTKRCVYRGAGAPCRSDYANITDEGLRKNLTCAPNFYCASLSAAAFNTEVARYGRPLDELLESPNHYYGQDANILGRPKHYIADDNLPFAVQTTLAENFLLTDSTGAGQFGLCRPGKRLPSYQSTTNTNDWQPSQQHRNKDSSNRTDYISQIGGCNSTLYTDLRYSSCPMLDESGNYIHTQDDFLNGNFLPEGSSTALDQRSVVKRYSALQNSCGLESLSSSVILTTQTQADDLADFSAFKTIEGLILGSEQALIEPTLARDACLRKPGAVCHTDLDCSPNKLMAQVIDLANPDYFGNEAEKKYYEEYLVCGQGETEPRNDDSPNFNTYEMSNNRCCRPIGETLTMYTEDSPNALESEDLRTDVFGSFYPNEPRRYSRYSVASTSVDATTLISNSITRPSANTEDNNLDQVLDNSVNITQNFQWKTIHDTAAKTCCGGTWVRKFADGTNNWSKNRLSLNVDNFKCLNYNSPLLLSNDPTVYGVTNAQLDNDRVNFCADPTLVNGGCVEKKSGAINSFSDAASKPILDTTALMMVIDTDPEIMTTQWQNNLWAYHTLLAQNGDVNPVQAPLVLDWTDADKTDANRRFIRTRLPSFIAYLQTDLSDLVIQLEDPSNPNNHFTCQEVTPTNGSYSCGNGNVATFGGLCDDSPQATNTPWNANACSTQNPGASCCFAFDRSSRTIAIAYNNAISDDSNNYGDEDNYYSARISWTAPGTLKWEADNVGGFSVDNADYLVHRRSSSGASALYYLERLSKLEYLGIPQMVYEPIYCNDNYQKLVPGIFEEVAFGQKLQTVIDFVNHLKTFYDVNSSTPWRNDLASGSQNANALNQNLVATQELISHPQIFSDHEFMCCLELGSPATDKSQCCSGHLKNAAGQDPTCALPDGTDLTVYFNKFVSGEGLSDTYSDTTLTTAEFDARTGEPELTTAVIQKLTALGETFCASGQVRRGAAFGNFEARPLGPLRDAYSVVNEAQYTIVDSIFDFGSINNQNVGYIFFNAGLRWNHHVYCDVSDL